MSRKMNFVLKCAECGIEMDCSNFQEDWIKMRRKQLKKGHQWHCGACTFSVGMLSSEENSKMDLI